MQSIGGGKGEFATWFDALEWMEQEVDKREFDIAIIGCGAYGFNLAAHIKRKGKKAIHLGGATQLLFGITGKRWEENEDYKIAYMIQDKSHNNQRRHFCSEAVSSPAFKHFEEVFKKRQDKERQAYFQALEEERPAALEKIQALEYQCSDFDNYDIGERDIECLKKVKESLQKIYNLAPNTLG